MTPTMNDQHHDLKVDSETGGTVHADTGRGGISRQWATWLLALLTAPGAAIVMIFALGAVMSSAASSDQRCPNLGPSGIGFDVLFYGAVAVSLLTIVVTFFTAPRRWGISVPLCGLALLALDIGVIAISFRR